MTYGIYAIKDAKTTFSPPTWTITMLRLSATLSTQFVSPTPCSALIPLIILFGVSVSTIMRMARLSRSGPRPAR